MCIRDSRISGHAPHRERRPLEYIQRVCPTAAPTCTPCFALPQEGPGRHTAELGTAGMLQAQRRQ
eukprot:4970710-Alexandrium_andersonii.AAC.1